MGATHQRSTKAVQPIMPTSLPSLEHGHTLHHATAYQVGENIDRGLVHHGNYRLDLDIGCAFKSRAGCRDLLQAGPPRRGLLEGGGPRRISFTDNVYDATIVAGHRNCVDFVGAQQFPRRLYRPHPL
jgi:hypothetical protein